MKKVFFVISIALGASLAYYYHTNNKCQLAWSKTVDPVTIEDSWLTYKEYFAQESLIHFTKEQFLERVQTASYSTISIDEFLQIPIENHRLRTYKNAQTAEQAYPENDRPRADKDIESVQYFLKDCHQVSPITVALITDKQGKKRYIKLDGVHRLIAANILKQKVRVLWIDLTTPPSN